MRMRARMRATLLTLAALAATGVAQQQQGGPQQGAPQNDEQQKIRIEGRVTSAAGEPLSKATVRLMPGNLVITSVRVGPVPFQGSASATTDEQGNFVLDNLTAGTFNLMAERTGFVTQRYGARAPNAPGTPLTLKEGDRLTALTIELLPQAVIAGRVTDQDGDPLQGIQVRAARQVYDGGRRQLRTEGTAASDDQGNFRIANLAPGRYFVIADPRPAGPMGAPVSAPVTERQETANIETYFPNSLEQRGASPIDLAAGDQRLGVNFQMRRERVFSIRGVAVDLATGKPAANASVLALPPDAEVGPGALSGSVRTGPDGAFQIHNLPAGTYRVHATAGGAISLASGNGMMIMRMSPEGRADIGGSGSAEVTIGTSDVNDLPLVLSAGARIDGTMRIEGGELSELQLNAQQQQQGPGGLPPLPSPTASGVRLMPVAGLSVNGPSTRTNPDGTFEITGVGAARYTVNISTPQQAGLYVKSITFGGQDVTRRPLDLTGGGGGRMEIVLAKGAAELSGTVANKDGQAMSGITVSLWPKEPDLSRADGGARVATTDQNGTYRFTRLTPGDYFVAAWEELPDPGLGQYTEFLNRFTGAAAAVELSVGGTQSAAARLVDRDTILAELAKLP